MRKGKLRIIIFFLSSLCIYILISMLWDSNDTNRSVYSSVSLVKPAFAQESGISFLEEEAGISAYTLSEKKIDLKKARNAFKLIEKETDKYIIGSFSLSGYKNYAKEDIRLFVHTDGWVVVYYMKGDPTAKMIALQNLGTTKLAMALNEACGLVGATIPYTRHYHFQFPDADKFAVFARKVSNSFRILVPESFVVFERSWSGGSSIYIDDKSISGSYDSGYGTIPYADLKQGVFHWVRGENALVLVYRES